MFCLNFCFSGTKRQFFPPAQCCLPTIPGSCPCFLVVLQMEGGGIRQAVGKKAAEGDPYTGTTQTINGVRYAVLKGPLGSTIDAEIKLR